MKWSGEPAASGRISSSRSSVSLTQSLSSSLPVFFYRHRVYSTCPEQSFLSITRHDSQAYLKHATETAHDPAKNIRNCLLQFGCGHTRRKLFILLN